MGADKLVPRVLSVLISLSVTIACNQSSAFAKSDNSPLSEVEQRLFFKTYSEETNDERLERLEKRVFGTVMTGSFEERLNKVSVASQPQVNPDGSMTGNVQQSDTSTAGNTSSAPAKSAAQIQEEERQAAAERARIAAQAAKEEAASQTMSEGVELWRARKGPDALAKFEQVIRMQPNNADAYFSAGIIYESTGNLAEAKADYQKAADIRSDNKDYIDAVHAVQKKMAAAANISPKQAEINRLTEQAGAAYKRQEYLSALDLYKQLDFMNPNQALVKFNIGTLYLQIKDPFTALQYYKSAATLNPKEPRYVTAYQKLQNGVQQEEAAQEQSNAKWTAAGYDLAHIGESPQANAQSGPAQNAPNNQGNVRRPVLNMGQQASNQSTNNNGGMQQQQQPPMQSATLTPPQGFIPADQTQFAPTGIKPTTSTKSTKAKSQPQTKQKPQQAIQPQQMQQQMPPQMQQQMQQQIQQMQQPQQQMQQPMQQQQMQQPMQQNYNNGANQGIDPAAAREMQAVLQQNMQQGTLPPNYGAPAQASAPAQNPTVNVPVNNYRPGFTPAPGNQGANNSAPPTLTGHGTQAKTPAKNAALPGNNKFGFEPPPPDAAATYGIIAGASKDGIRATEVGIGSRASRAGLRKGDLIRAIDGTVLRSVQQLNDYLTKKNGGSVQLYVQRNSQMATLTL
jgi:tetratricopeptide (TPR) repeat protein